MPDAAATSHDLLGELRARHLLHQCTDEEGLRAHLAEPRNLYCGFDPSADSLTIGNLVPMMLLRRFKRAGHNPVVLTGGATGRIGDPSGKDAERTLMTGEQVQANIDAHRPIFNAVLGDETEIVDNYSWFRSISFLEALRDIGKHFSVNQMVKRDAVRNRLERDEQGISYTEFSYMLLQAYDFLHLYRDRAVTLQAAGADQWGNIVSGTDLIRRAEGNAEPGAAEDADAPLLAFGLTAPLLLKADGTKCGKTESGAVWLSAHRTSPYAYYQFWLNAADADVDKFLKIFTDLTLDEIEELTARHADAPFKREAQRTLAQHATTILHGEVAMQNAEAAAAALFSGEVASLDVQTLEEVFAEVPSSTHARSELEAGAPLVEILPQTSLASSKSEARTHLNAGAVSVNGQKVEGEDAVLTTDHLLHGSVITLRRGKKNWHVTRWG